MIGDLLPQHAELIRASAISPEVARDRGYRSVITKAQLRQLGFSRSQQRVPALVIPIHGIDGKIAQHQVRPDEPRTVRGKVVKYETPSGSRMVLDVPPSCLGSLGDPSVPLYITEGVRKADAAASAGLCCVGLLGVWGWRGTNKLGGKVVLADWDSVALNDRDVYVVFDSDVTTKPQVQSALRSFTAFLERRDAKVHVVRLPAGVDGSKTGLDDYLADGHSAEELVALASSHDPVGSDTKVGGTGAQSERRTAVKAPAIAYETDILDRFANEIAMTGVAGEVRTLKLIFLVVVSRLLDRIVSLAVKGPSAGGKSFLVNSVLRYFPESAYYAMTAMSERALVYDDAPLAHRMIVVYEAAGISGDLQSYLIRSLLSEGRVRYTTIQRTKGKLKPVVLEREGPTGLIVTTTATRLHPENETRLLSLGVSDTAEQTTAVLLAQAADGGLAGNVGPWHDLQQWLEAGPTAVDLPYAEALARAVPPVAVRLRRDFPTVLSLIRAHALLHRATREVSGGRIVATLADYGAVRELASDLVAEAVAETVSDTVRETVNAVAEAALGQGEATVVQVAKILSLDKSAASRRVRSAIDQGYVKNLEDRRGRPLRLTLGEPMPDGDVSVLPTVVELERLHGCRPSEGGTAGGSADSSTRGAVPTTPHVAPATAQPPDGQDPFFGVPLTPPRLCPSCHQLHPVGRTCERASGHATN